MIEICTRNRLSVFISLILRHKPEAAGTILDKHSLADVKELLAGIRETGLRIGMEELVWIVAVGGKMILPPHGKEFFRITVSSFLHNSVRTFYTSW